MQVKAPMRTLLLFDRKGCNDEGVGDAFTELSSSLSKSWTIDAYIYGKTFPAGAHGTKRSELLEMLTSLRNIKTGKVLFVIEAHGVLRRQGEKTHSIDIENGIFSLDTLEKPIQDLRRRGIQVALVDLTCYSGTTQALEDIRNLCIITDGTVNYVTASTDDEDLGFFDRAFVANARDEQLSSLEDLFLRAAYLGQA